MKTAIALACAFLFGCGTVTTYRFPLAPPSGRVSPTPPAVFFEGKLPAAPMQELAMVESVGSGTKASAEEVVNALSYEAARFGADAVVRVKVDCAYSQCHAWGVAVKFIGR